MVVGDPLGGGEVVGGRHDDAGLPLHRLEDDRGDGVVDGGRERGHVVVRHEGDVARQGLERLAVGGLGREGQRAHGAAVEGALGGDEPGAAGPAGELERGLVGLGAGVAEEDTRVVGPAEEADEALGQGDLWLGGEEVGHVAERAELGGDGLDEGGVGVAEGVDGDAAEQVDVLLAVGVPHVRALPAGEGQHGRAEGVHHGAGVAVLDAHVASSRRVGLAHPRGDAGEHLGADPLVGEDLEQHGVGLAAVDDRGARYPAGDGLVAGPHLGDHARVEGRQHLAERLGADLLDQVVGVAVVAVEALDVGEDQQLLGSQRDREGRGGGVRVDVVDLAVDVGRDRADDRHPAGLDEVEDRLGPHLGDLADEAQVDLGAVDDRAGGDGAEEAGVLPRQADGQCAVLVDEADELALHLADEHHPDDVHRLGRGHPQPAAELRLDAELVEHPGDLRAAAVHDDGLEAGEAQERDVLGEGDLEGLVGHRVAAVLHDDRAAVVALEPRQGRGQRAGLGRVGAARVLDGLGHRLGHEL